MLKRALGILLFLSIVAIVLLNFDRLLAFGQARLIQQSAQPAIAAENWEKAVEIYEGGYKQYADNSMISLRLAWLYRRNNQPEQAETTYKKILEKTPDHKEALVGLADLQAADPKRMNDAVVVYRRALKAHPNDAALLAQVGDLYKRAAENPEETRAATRKWLYDQARYYYQTSLKLKPQQFQTQFNLGVTLQNVENLQPAAEAYCEAVMLNPGSYEARYNLGLVLSELDYIEEAYRQMDRAVKMLAENDQIETAQALALKVQNIKNRIYNSGKQGLSSRPNPPFLKEGCLYQAVDDGANPAATKAKG